MRISDWSSDVCSSDLSLVTADILSSYSAAERPQTDIERQALLAEINGLVSGSIEAAFDPRADQGVEVYEASSARWGWMAFVVAALVGLAGAAWAFSRVRPDFRARTQIGRASCRERVGQYV